MGRGEDRELLQVYRVLAGEVVRNRKKERLLEEAAEAVTQSHELVADANREIAYLREELNEAQLARNVCAREADRARALDVILSDERDDADEAALWLEAIAILCEPEPLRMEADQNGFPVRCLRCGGDKARGGEADDGEGGFLCWACWRQWCDRDHDKVDYVNEWFNLGRRDFPR